ncbi:MAG TPA: pyridoxamine 5'-phosphate oxidase [Meiothermus sp.]|nr:pyridoxamine 5'-phosphate oxidase [Meiothermus sp.]
MDLSNLRYDYTRGELDESDVSPDPIEQFGVWLEAALAANLTEPYGMTLSTVGENHRPSSRVVLLRGFSAEGFIFYTNYHSRKGRELEAHPYAALNFWWPPLERQVRIEGRVEKVSAEESDFYFASRPYESQAASASSPQSEPIPSREALLFRIEQTKRQHPERVPRPLHWGGYRLQPDYFEFWQGRKSRIHDRLAYMLEPGGGWKITRLAP